MTATCVDYLDYLLADLTPKQRAKLEFGEAAGHPFRGNQWKSGEGEDRAPKVDPLKSVSESHPTKMPDMRDGHLDSDHTLGQMHKAATFIDAGLPPLGRTAGDAQVTERASMLKSIVAADISARMSDIPAADVVRAAEDGHVASCASDLGRSDVVLWIDDQGRLGRTERENDVFDVKGASGRTDAEWQSNRLDQLAERSKFYGVPPDRAFGADDPRAVGIVHEAATSALVQSWAMSSNDTSGRALGIQERTAAIFGVRSYSTWEDQTTPSLARETDDYVRENGKTVDAFLTAQYEATQAAFKDAGITELQLYRGASFPEERTWTPEGGRRTMTQDDFRPISAWSSSPGQAQRFADMRTGDSGRTQPVTHAATVPVERILSSPRTGFGCYDESEFVVIAGPGEMHTRLAG